MATLRSCWESREVSLDRPESSARNLSCHSLLFSVVAHKFSASVFDAYAVRGNSALLRCHIPANVRDFVRVSSWTRQDGVTVGTLGETGKNVNYGVARALVRSRLSNAIPSSLRLFD